MRPPGRRYFENLVYRTLYPTPDSKDPRSFDEFVRQFLVKEVRLENVRYYGSEEDRGEELDALYPGHDYWSIASRNRLGQFPFHRWLFEVFDHLRLTRDEIEMLCTWEGTKSAKKRYEAEKGMKIVDLAWDLRPEPPRRSIPTVVHHNLPVRRKKHKTRTSPPTPTAPLRHDYYGDPNIWGNFNTSPTPLPRGRDRTLLRGPIGVAEAINYPPAPGDSVRSDPYQEWLSIMRRAGSHGIYASPSSSWSPTDILQHYGSVVTPVYSTTSHIATPRPAYNTLAIPAPGNPSFYTTPLTSLPSANANPQAPNPLPRAQHHRNNAIDLGTQTRPQGNRLHNFGNPLRMHNNTTTMPTRTVHDRDRFISRIEGILNRDRDEELPASPIAAYRYHSRISDATIEALARTLGG